MSEHIALGSGDDQRAPPWVMTFADLMSLLMCFFVLLLSFSEMDVLKYKQVAGSMKFAFGVQRTIPADEIPKGTSIITQEFSPGKPQPTLINEVRQVTTDEHKQNLDFTDSTTKNMHAEAEIIRKKLREEIEQGLLEVEVFDDQVVIRIREHGSFASGSAKIRTAFLPVIGSIIEAVNSIEGHIIVAGHTDNRPIATPRFPSNWVLSSARAANVVHAMTRRGGVDPTRMQIRAHADVLPLAPNSTAAGRGKNRRVEITVLASDSNCG